MEIKRAYPNAHIVTLLWNLMENPDLINDEFYIRRFSEFDDEKFEFMEPVSDGNGSLDILVKHYKKTGDVTGTIYKIPKI